MAKKTVHTRQQHIDKQIDRVAQLIQLVALLGLVTLMIIDFTVANTNIEPWVKGGLLAIAIGMSPVQVLELAKSVVKGLPGINNNAKN